MVEDIIDDNNVVLHVLKPLIASHLFYLVTDIIIGRCRASKGGPLHPRQLEAWRKSPLGTRQETKDETLQTSHSPTISTVPS